MSWRKTTAFAVAVLMVSQLFVAGAVAFGLRLESLRFLPGFRPAALDYRSQLAGVRFSPLRAAFVDRALGGLGVGAEGGRSAGGGTGRGGGGDGTAGAATAGRLRLPVVEHPFTNDDVAHAAEIDRVPFRARTDTRRATREAGEPTDCSPVGGTAWYRLVAPRDTGIIVNTFGSDYSTVLGVFTGGDGRFDRVACDTDVGGNALVAFAASRGTSYWIQVSGPTGGGTLTLNVVPQGTTERVSLSATGGEASTGAGETEAGVVLSMSADGRYVVFDSGSKLVPQDTHGRRQIYVRDRANGTTRLASTDDFGNPADNDSYDAVISATGRYVAFTSWAGNLDRPRATGCPLALLSLRTNECLDVFVKDLESGDVERVSVSSAGQDANDISSPTLTITPDGRYVAFTSAATNLTPGIPSDTNGNVFLRDRLRGTTELISVAPDGGGVTQAQNPSISADGRYVAFEDWGTGGRPVGRTTDGSGKDKNTLFVRDRVAGKTTMISTNQAGEPADSNSLWPVLTPDGRYVAFESLASNLVPGDTYCGERAAVGYDVQNTAEQLCWDVFVKDLRTGAVTLVSASSTGEHGNRSSRQPAISADGRYVAFHSLATNLVGRDDNQKIDVFVRDLATGTTTLASVSSAGTQGDGDSTDAFLSGDGRYVGFASDATNLVADDRNGKTDVFVHDSESG